MKHKKQNANCGNKDRNKTHADQIDDVAICPPLGPVLANIFLGDSEEKWLLNKNARPFDTLTIPSLFDIKNTATQFLHYLN